MKNRSIQDNLNDKYKVDNDKEESFVRGLK